MKNKKLYTILLVVSIVIVAAVVFVKNGLPGLRTMAGLPEKKDQTEISEPSAAQPEQTAQQEPVTKPDPEVIEPLPLEPQTQEPEVQDPDPEAPDTQDPNSEDPNSQEQEEEPEAVKPNVLIDQVVDRDYFNDTLFIGDSRTVGLQLYGGYDNATYFAATSMTAFGVMDSSVEVTGKGTYTLSNLLSSYKFNKIYIMLGINEVGYELESVVNQNKKVVALIRELQPQAAIIYQANIHVSYSRSSTDSVVNNERINKLNSMLSELADGEHVFYIDFNSIYDDEGGNLNSEYTGDATHMYAKYYPQWGEYLLNHAIILPDWE